MLHLNDLIQIHTKRTLGALNAQPQRYEELQTWLQMILVLSSWFMALYAVRVTA